MTNRTRAARLRIAVAALVALTAAATVVGVVLVTRSVGTRTITLSMASDAAAMCMPVADFAASALAASTVELSGTVDGVEGDGVHVAVDRLYRGGPATRVVLTVPQNAEDPTTLVAGERVLVAAADGRVLGCGLSGEASPDLQRFYDAAF